MAIRTNEVETAMNTIINDILAIQSTFIIQVTLKLVVDVSNNLLEAIGIINSVTESWSVHNC